MRFIQIEIYGFGKWVDQIIQFSNEHPLCIYGKNESGKSTVQQFILYVLFGLPPRKLKLFKPMQSNKIGGRLMLEDSIVGRYQIERIEQKVLCYLPNGEVKDEAWLKTHLQGINREVYTSIYAFSAIELAEIKQMKKSDISDVLLSVGLTGSTKIYEAEKDIETKLGNLFKKQGRVPFINQQINTVKEGHKTLIDRQQKEATYNQKQEELEELKLEIEEINETKLAINAQIFKIEKVLHALPQIKEYQVIQTKLVNGPSNQPFPEQGVERLERVQEKLLPLQGELRMEEMQLQKNVQAVESLEASLIDEQTIHTVQTVLQQKATYDYLHQEEKSFTTKIRQIENNVKADLDVIRLDEEVVAHVDLPFYLEKKWRQLQQTREKLLQEEESQAIRNEEINRREAELEQLFTEEQAREETSNTFELTRSKQNEGKKHGEWKQWGERRLKVAKNMLLILSILAALSFAFALYNDSAILFTVPIVMLLAGIIQYINTKNTINLLLQQSNLNELDRTTQPQSNQLQKEKQQQINIERMRWQEDQKNFLKKENTWIQQMEAEQQAYPFLQHIELDYWLDLLNEIRDVQRKYVEIKQLQQDIGRVREHIKQIKQDVKHASKKLSMDELTFQKLQEMLEKQQTNEHFIRQYRESMEQSTSTIEALKKKISVFEEEITKLFVYAEVKDEEAYLQIAKKITNEQKMRNDMSRLTQSLEMLLGKEELAVLLEQPLTESELLVRQEELQMKETEIEQQLSSLNKQVASIELEIRHLELSDDHSAAIYQHQMERDTLQKMANEWASLKVAQAALKNAKKNYQKHHLEEVMQQTSQYFRTITDGAYIKVIAPEDNGLFEVEGNQQVRYTVDKLSQGTIDQLYVSLRLAISVVMNKINRIPFMIDDAFVHFDSTRMHNIIQVLTSIRQDQQIIIFTCRDDIASLFKQVHKLD